MPNRLVYIGFAYCHHLHTHAGCHQIQQHLRYDVVMDEQKFHDFAHE